MKKLGVIGGLGPMATAYLLQLVTQMSDARTDQEHMEVLVHSRPQIPDRTRFILGESMESPVPMMAEVGRGLVSRGAEVLAIPCITGHYFRRRLEEEIGVPIIDAILEAALCLRRAGVEQVGVMATDGTIACGLLQETFTGQGIRCVLPGQDGQREVMRVIYEDIKAGAPPDLAAFGAVSEELFRDGSQAVLLACTELSLVKRDYGNSLGAGYLDILEVLARQAVLSCGRLKQEYDRLL